MLEGRSAPYVPRRAVRIARPSASLDRIARPGIAAAPQSAAYPPGRGRRRRREDYEEEDDEEDEVSRPTRRARVNPHPPTTCNPIEPKTAAQRTFRDLLRSPSCDIVVACGPTGTGKTHMAIAEGLRALARGEV